MSSRYSNEQLKAEALRLGFSACEIAEAAPVDSETADAYRQWIADGGQADMHYMENYLEKRLDPTLLLPGARSIVVVALNYAPAQRIPDSEYQLAVYAYGRDYHDILKSRLRQLLSFFPADAPDTPEHLIATDTVPILERYWAMKAGIGFIGRNHQLIIPQAGSLFFLGEIITTAAFDHYGSPMPCRCGTCHRCTDACPTGALGESIFNSSKCLSYQTIENRNDIDEAIATKMGTTIYGCDRCQDACPWNRFAMPTEIPELQPSEELLAMTRDDWHRLTREDYQRLFKGSAVKRAKYEGLMRNIKAMTTDEQK
jgi:epoxyqueuosine reductase